MTVTSTGEAWKEANKLFPTDYEIDEVMSLNAGYGVYRHPTLNPNNRILVLDDRLVVLTGAYGNNITDIWIKEPETLEQDILSRFTTAELIEALKDRHGVDISVTGRHVRAEIVASEPATVIVVKQMALGQPFDGEEETA